MVATLQWQNSTGATGSPVWSTITTLRFKDANNNTDDLNNPLVRPTSGVVYSYEKALRINISVAPSNPGNVSNLRLAVSRNPIATGVDIFYKFASSYTGPLAGDALSIGTYTQINSTNNITWTGATAQTTTGQWGQLLYLVARVGASASGGEVASWETIARYDEI
jgi:hypothetical protein